MKKRNEVFKGILGILEIKFLKSFFSNKIKNVVVKIFQEVLRKNIFHLCYVSSKFF